ncbi:hypothetical protein BDZ89DRAFT_1073051 [Hymenopellis radicata]|nr:hypothetical protein BDZ89DRAFT_1073051 [Hymenopellis radicata]
MAPIRPHQKTRTGCLTCRKRKVKCDETSITCDNCSRRKMQCVWPDPSKASSPKSPKMPRPTPSPELSLCRSAPPFDMTTLEIMHHYTSVAYNTVYDQPPEAAEIWRTVVPRLAFSAPSPFLLHSILAFSALHLHSLYGSEPKGAEYLRIARSYNTLAVRALPASQDLAQNADQIVLFLTYILGARYKFATESSVSSQSEWFAEIGRSALWTQLDRWDRYRKTDIGLLIRALDSTDEAVSRLLDTDVTHALFPHSLSRLHLPTPDAPDGDEVRDPAVSETYAEAINLLRRAFTASLLPDCQAYAASIWVTSMSDSFMELLCQRRPRALIIAGHYCAIMHRMKGPWWARKGWSDELSRIRALLDDRWQRWLDWMPPDACEGMFNELELGSDDGLMDWMSTPFLITSPVSVHL